VFRGDPTQPGNEAFFNDMTYWRGAGNVSEGGLDNSLFSTTIALTSARLAYLSFDTRYNVNQAAGNPPDSVRVEISQDNGNTWAPINLGIRMDAGISGGGAAPAWVNSASLARLESNLSGWAGSVIRLRFRVVTATDGRLHRDANPGGGPENFGVWIDNIRIFGQSSRGLAAEAGTAADRGPPAPGLFGAVTGSGAAARDGEWSGSPASAASGPPASSGQAAGGASASPGGGGPRARESGPWSDPPALPATLVCLALLALARLRKRNGEEAHGEG
jgi:hypothetical protein